jgi:hypothetical protein
MARDEAPAATFGGINGKRNVTAEIGIGLDDAGFKSQGSGPTSLVAAEFHLGRASGPQWRPAALQHSNCVPRGRRKFRWEFKGDDCSKRNRAEWPPLISTWKPKN